ncbi:MAG: ergothioneine biosynthesis protein EgtB [Bacteroidota bacterium]
MGTKPSPPESISQQLLLKQFLDIRHYTERLCEPLTTEDYIPQPVEFISPPKWHLAHVTWFFEEFVLKIYVSDYKIYHEDFSYLFNSYYNAVGKRVLRADRGNITRPGVEEVYAYRKYVDNAMQDFFTKNELDDSIKETVILGLNHEQQHQELFLTDFKYILGHNPLFPVYKNNFSLVEQFNHPSENGYLKIEEQISEIGFAGTGFHYDNELGRHKVFLHEFEISKALVTNQEYLDFMNDGGYERSDLWLDEGWSWVNNAKTKAPFYWHKIAGEWFYYTYSGLKKVNPKAILCHINFYEAAAFAEWKGMRLPTEFEWECAADKINWGSRWEWTNSAYLPYPGFAKAEGAIGEYNGKFMINQMVLRGSSTATSPDHSRKTYRNFFHPHLRWQCTGIRLAKKH